MGCKALALLLGAVGIALCVAGEELPQTKEESVEGARGLGVVKNIIEDHMPSPKSLIEGHVVVPIIDCHIDRLIGTWYQWATTATAEVFLGNGDCPWTQFEKSDENTIHINTRMGKSGARLATLISSTLAILCGRLSYAFLFQTNRPATMRRVGGQRDAGGDWLITPEEGKHAIPLAFFATKKGPDDDAVIADVFRKIKPGNNDISWLEQLRSAAEHVLPPFLSKHKMDWVRAMLQQGGSGEQYDYVIFSDMLKLEVYPQLLSTPPMLCFLLVTSLILTCICPIPLSI
ncbi:unnamed protein product [Chrysoparadoxa australica]